MSKITEINVWKHINVDIFNTCVDVHFGTDSVSKARETLKKHLKKTYPSDVYRPDLQDRILSIFNTYAKEVFEDDKFDVQGCVIPGNGIALIHIRMNPKEGGSGLFACISHECVHATKVVIDHANLKSEAKLGGEVEANIQAYLFQECINQAFLLYGDVK